MITILLQSVWLSNLGKSNYFTDNGACLEITFQSESTVYHLCCKLGIKRELPKICFSSSAGEQPTSIRKKERETLASYCKVALSIKQKVLNETWSWDIFVVIIISCEIGPFSSLHRESTDNPRHACAAGITVLGMCVILSVCLLPRFPSLGKTKLQKS